jgi:hypothetical protein
MPSRHASVSLIASTLGGNVFSDENLLSLARASGLFKRHTAKLTPKVLLASSMAMVGASSSSFLSLAGMAGVFSQITVSRQAVAQRFGLPMRDFLRSVLMEAMAAQCAHLRPR